MPSRVTSELTALCGGRMASTSDTDAPTLVRTSRQNGKTRIVLGSLNPQSR